MSARTTAAASPTRSRLRTHGVLAWLRLMRVSHQIERAAWEHLRCFGLSPAQFDVLAHVGAAEGVIQQELADALLVTKGNVTQLLDRMEHDGWLARRQEGRTKRVCLTDRGRELFATVIPEHEALIAAQFAALTPPEQAELHRLLRNVDRSLSARNTAGYLRPSAARSDA